MLKKEKEKRRKNTKNANRALKLTVNACSRHVN